MRVISPYVPAPWALPLRTGAVGAPHTYRRRGRPVPWASLDKQNKRSHNQSHPQPPGPRLRAPVDLGKWNRWNRMKQFSRKSPLRPVRTGPDQLQTSCSIEYPNHPESVPKPFRNRSETARQRSPVVPPLNPAAAGAPTPSPSTGEGWGEGDAPCCAATPKPPHPNLLPRGEKGQGSLPPNTHRRRGRPLHTGAVGAPYTPAPWALPLHTGAVRFPYTPAPWTPPYTPAPWALPQNATVCIKFSRDRRPHRRFRPLPVC